MKCLMMSRKECGMHGIDDLVVCLAEFYRHVGRHINGFDDFYIMYGVSQRNWE